MKNERGITLVGLVVTIIIMSIIIGTVLNMTIRRKWNNKKSSNSSRKI